MTERTAARWPGPTRHRWRSVTLSPPTPSSRGRTRGRYYDSRILQSLSGDEALTLVGRRLVQHWENGFGEGAYTGHALSLGVRLEREGAALLSGEANGEID